MKTNVCILGAGAMGCLYGAYLSRNPALNLTFITHDRARADLLNQNGISISENGQLFHFPVHASVSGVLSSPADFVLVFVKAHQTLSAMDANSSLFGKKTLVLSLQNGLGGLMELRKKIPDDRFIAGISNHNSTQFAPAQILHAASGKTIIGSFCGNDNPAAKIQNLFAGTGMNIEQSRDIQRVIWEKLFVNLAINPLTMLYQVKNGEILENREISAMAKELVREALSVANAEGIFFDYEQIIRHVFEVAKVTGNGRSSMLQDRLNKRRTEINEINGAILTLAQKHGIKVPLNEKIVQDVLAVENLQS